MAWKYLSLRSGRVQDDGLTVEIVLPQEKTRDCWLRLHLCNSRLCSRRPPRPEEGMIVRERRHYWSKLMQKTLKCMLDNGANQLNPTHPLYHRARGLSPDEAKALSSHATLPLGKGENQMPSIAAASARRPDREPVMVPNVP